MSKGSFTRYDLSYTIVILAQEDDSTSADTIIPVHQLTAKFEM